MEYYKSVSLLSFTDDEEREKLAKELSKDWNSGRSLSTIVLTHFPFIFLLMQL